MNASAKTVDPRSTFDRPIPEGTKILVVEDESIIAWDVEQLLRDCGARDVLVAPSLRQARTFLAEHPDVGLILIDLKLEGGSGTDLIPLAQEQGIPVIITTGYDYHGGGHFPVVSKPYSTDDLISAILDAMKA
ncbi:MAG: response regulator [Aestuariivirga sp.]